MMDGGWEGMMKRCVLAVVLLAFVFSINASAQKSFTLEQVLSAPFPSDLTAAKTANRVAWAFDQQGKRNIWVAEAPGYAARQVTKHNEDDGQKNSARKVPARRLRYVW